MWRRLHAEVCLWLEETFVTQSSGLHFNNVITSFDPFPWQQLPHWWQENISPETPTYNTNITHKKTYENVNELNNWRSTFRSNNGKQMLLITGDQSFTSLWRNFDPSSFAGYNRIPVSLLTHQYTELYFKRLGSHKGVFGKYETNLYTTLD